MDIVEFEQKLIENNGIITRKNIINFRNAYFKFEKTGAWVQDLLDLADNIDFVNSHPLIYYLYEKVLVDFLLTDDDQSDITGIYDVVTQNEGDQLVTRLQASALPNDLKIQILLKIEESASDIQSQNLLNAIATAKTL